MSKHQLRDARAKDILTRVRRQIRLEELLLEQEGWVLPGREKTSGEVSGGEEDIGEMAEQLRALYAYADDGFAANAAKIGAMPPVYPSFRGKIGHFTIGVLQRVLWWYTSSIEKFAHSLRTHLQGTTEAVGTLAWMLRANQREIAMLREEVRMLRERQSNFEGAPR